VREIESSEVAHARGNLVVAHQTPRILRSNGGVYRESPGCMNARADWRASKRPRNQRCRREAVRRAECGAPRGKPVQRAARPDHLAHIRPEPRHVQEKRRSALRIGAKGSLCLQGTPPGCFVVTAHTRNPEQAVRGTHSNPRLGKPSPRPDGELIEMCSAASGTVLLAEFAQVHEGSGVRGPVILTPSQADRPVQPRPGACCLTCGSREDARVEGGFRASW
jgi:hypothetical protein